MRSPEIHTLTGAYALDALPDDERRDFERHLVECGACQREVDEFRATAAHLAAAEYEEPPSELKDRVLAEIDRVRQEAPRTVVPLRRERTFRRTLMAVAAVLAAVAVGLGVVTSNLDARVDSLEARNAELAQILSAPDARTVALETSVGGVAKFVYSSSEGEAVFLARGLPRLSQDQVYELWLIGEEGPVPAGLFHADADGTAMQMMASGIGSAQAVAVTVEPSGGSEQPTSDPIVVLELDRS